MHLIEHSTKKQISEYNQQMFEVNIPINVPYIYQKHFFIQKVNKKGKVQDRLIVLSNKVRSIVNKLVYVQFRS